MKSGFLFMLFFILSCSQAPIGRGPASETAASEFDVHKSSVKVFTSKDIFLDLRDARGRPVDVDLASISLKKANGRKVKFQIERSAKGKFYLVPAESEKLKGSVLKIYVKNNVLAQDIRPVLIKPARNNSWIKAIRSERNGLTLKLFLADTKNRPVELSGTPEIILEGQAQIGVLEQVAPGTWEFELNYPNYNQVIYVSVRVNGIVLADLFRVQHIEK